MINTTIAQYRILEELGRGGMGVVYRAEDTRLGRMVAMKFMTDELSRDERSRDRFLNEARAAAALSHPNIATLYGIEEVEGRNFITMEYVEGRPLTDVIGEGPLPVERALDLALQIARGLERAHETGIVHRDIKPANIKVTPRGEVKILDFGLAKLSGVSDVSQTGTTVGTAAYMSPQQVLGEEVDATTDLWSLGVVLYEMLSGRSPFAQQYVHALYYQILNETAPAVSSLRPDVDPALDGVVERLLAKETRHRYPGASELIDDLVRLKASAARPEPSEPAAAARAVIREAVEDSAVRRQIERERRQMTVLYCELANFGDLADDLDPEDMEEASSWLRSTAQDIIRRYGGTPEMGAGGGMFGYFGYPTAHEQDPEHAVRCASDIVAKARAWRSGPSEVRIGIHTGMAVVRTSAAGVDVQGAAGEVAVRFAELAEPGAVLVGKSTQRLCGREFDMRALGLQDVRGYSEPQPLFSIAGIRDSVEARVAEPEIAAPPLVGRGVELGLLRQRWQAARSGQGQAVLVSGEPGIGKSRLVEGFLEAEVTGPDVWMTRLACLALERNSDLHPLVAGLRSLVRPDSDRMPDLSDLTGFLLGSGITAGEDVALAADMLGIPVPDDIPRSTASPTARKNRLMQVLLQALTMGQGSGPGVLLIDDLHWADPSTLEWVEGLVEELPALSVMAIVTTRPPTRPDWLARTHASELTLGKLTPDDIATIARRRSGGKDLPPEIVEHVANRTDGIPLFAEELTSMIVESGLLQDAGDRYELTGPLPEHLIPSTLHGSLMARLDQHASARHVAQIGSVVGREIPFGLLHEVSDESVEDLTRELAQLVEAELMIRRGFIPSATFQFRHALIRDAAYHSLLRTQRRDLHARVAEALVDGAYDTAPEEIAQHLTEAALAERAIPYWIAAGRAAMGRNANREAVRHLRAGAALLDQLDAETNRDPHEVELLSLLGPAVMMTKGYADEEGENIFLRVLDICHRINAPQPFFFSLYGLVSVYLIRGEYDRSFDILDRSLAKAEEVGEDRYLVMSHNATGVARMFSGDPTTALGHLDTVLRLHDLERDDDLGLLGWGHLDVSAATSRQLALHLIGRPDEALAQAQASLGMAEGRGNHMTTYHAHLYAGLLYLMRRDWSACRHVMQTYLPMAIEYGDPFYIAISSVVLDLAQREPDQKEAFRQSRAILSRMREGGFSLGIGFLLAVMADGFLAHDEPEEAARAVDEALAHLDPRPGEFWEADVYRMKGETLRAAGAPYEDVERWFERALATARGQGIRALELRAAFSLATLWQVTGRTGDGRLVVARALEGIDGGTDTADVSDALALTASLPA